MCKGLFELLTQMNLKKNIKSPSLLPLNQIKTAPTTVWSASFFIIIIILFFSFAKVMGIFKLVYHRGHQKILPELHRKKWLHTLIAP